MTFINSQKRTRHALAQELSGLIVGEHPEFEAYEATPGDDSHFVIDRNNNWRVVFSTNEQGDTYEIRYRYGPSDYHDRQMAIFYQHMEKI